MTITGSSIDLVRYTSLDRIGHGSWRVPSLHSPEPSQQFHQLDSQRDRQRSVVTFACRKQHLQDHWCPCPGVATPCLEIEKNSETIYDYTSKGNLVAVISNGSAILGLGNLGSLASKPVMEGKSVLFKRFADIDSIDIEIDSKDTNSIIETIKNITTYESSHFLFFCESVTLLATTLYKTKLSLCPNLQISTYLVCQKIL